MDLAAPNPSTTYSEFIAVVLSGFGNDLSPLTNDLGDEPVPKALLPVANKPLLQYTFSWLEESGIDRILLICPLSHRGAVSHYIHSEPSCSSLRIDVQPYDQSPDLRAGTCTLLRHFASRIQQDFVLLPVDFIPPTTLPLAILLNKFRTETMAYGAIATTCWFESHRPDADVVVNEWGNLPSPVPIVWEQDPMSLLYIDTTHDADRDTEDICLKMGLLNQHAKLKLSASLQDSHVYVCKRSVLDVLHEKPHLESLKDDFFPWLCKIQYQRSKQDKYAHVLSPIVNCLPQSLALRHSTSRNFRSKVSRKPHFPPPQSWQSLTPYDAFGSVATSPTDPEDYEGELRVGLVIHRAADGFAIRVNNLHAYMEANRQFLEKATYTLPSQLATRSLIDPKAVISVDSMVGEFTRIGEKSSIKKSVIGRHCVIGKMVKMTRCVLMDHCVIGDGVKLEGCLLGKSVKVGANVELIRCACEAGFEVAAGERCKNEKLEASDWTTGVGQGDLESGEDEM